MPDCPQCGKNLHVPEVTKTNVETYGKPAIVKTLCCGKPITLHRVVTFRAYKYYGKQTTDDWGNPIEAERAVTKEDLLCLDMRH